MAGICALTWSCYSVLNWRFTHVSSDTVGGFCLATALLATLCHLMFEATTSPQSTLQWLAVFGLGLLPFRGRVLCLGLRHETRQHSGFGCLFLRDPVNFDACSD